MKIVLSTALLALVELCSLGAVPTTWAQSINSAICDRNLETEIRNVINPQLKFSRLGIFVEPVTSPSSPLANLDGDKFFVPASNTKLLTTATALHFLGKDARIKTSLLSTVLPDQYGEINTLWVVGRGDPSLSSVTSLPALVQQLSQKGVKKIRSFVLVPSLRGVDMSGSWEWQDLQEYYAAIASPFTLDANALDWTIKPTQASKPTQFSWDQPQLATGWQVQNFATTSASDGEYSLQIQRPWGRNQLIITGKLPQNAEPELGGTAIPNPQERFVTSLIAELKRQGITINASIPLKTRFFTSADDRLHELASVSSPNLTTLVQTTNKESNNLYAELLLRWVGSTDSQAEDSLARGIVAVQQFLQQQGINPDTILLADGSGLSRRNLATPHTLVSLLKIMANQPAFRNSLPIAGTDGTLTNRFSDSLKGKLRAKTGSMAGVAALSGYAKPDNYEELAFSIIINNSNLSGTELRQQIDAIAALLIRLRHC